MSPPEPSGAQSHENSLRKQLQAWIAERENVESEIKAITEELTSPGLNGAPAPGLKGNLVDQEGFPRADIDVYNVRLKRHRLACLQTDYKELMSKIEKGLEQVHSELKITHPMSQVERSNRSDLTVGERESQDYTAMTPFAIVRSVSEGSPAAASGLKQDDQVLAFGSIDASNHRNLAAVGDVVKRNVNTRIPVRVKRLGEDGNYTFHELSLIPMEWSGRGLLGPINSLASFFKRDQRSRAS